MTAWSGFELASFLQLLWPYVWSCVPPLMMKCELLRNAARVVRWQHQAARVNEGLLMDDRSRCGGKWLSMHERRVDYLKRANLGSRSRLRAT